MPRRIVGGALVALAALLLATSPALAHERRQVGPYTFVVGFLSEPAFTGYLNGVSLRVTETAGNKPVEGLQDTLEVDVTAAGQTKRFKLEAVSGQPGAYAAHLIPTRTGSWVFRFVGKVADRQIDESFESGPGRFHEPEDADRAKFPGEIPAERDESRAVAEQARLIAVAAVVAAVLMPVGLRLWRRA